MSHWLLRRDQVKASGKERVNIAGNEGNLALCCSDQDMKHEKRTIQEDWLRSILEWLKEDVPAHLMKAARIL